MTIGGFSKPRLDRMHQIMAGHVERGALPDLVTLVSRHGETHVDAIGTLAIDGDAPMRRYTIFRIASWTPLPHLPTMTTSGRRHARRSTTETSFVDLAPPRSSLR